MLEGLKKGTPKVLEQYLASSGGLSTVFDTNSAYAMRVREILGLLYPSVQINIINSGINGDDAVGCAARFERDVLAYNPDLVIMSFGLNDSVGGINKIDIYKGALREMLEKLKERDIEAIFLTENTMNTKVSSHLKEELFLQLAEAFSSKIQNNGVLKAYFDVAKNICAEYGVKVCDLYSIWERMAFQGVDTTELLANKLNHPIREFHYYMAIKLIETMLLD